MESLSRSWKNFKRSAKEFHTKKPHIEFFTALLTVPVLLTVIILNVNNLKGDEKETEKEPPTNQTIVITQPGSNENEKEEVVVTTQACEPGIGEVTIGFPEEGENVSDNPVMIDVDYEANGYCAVVWSYRVNGGTWSSYDDTSISLYNLPNGNVKLDLRVKSVVNSDTDSLSRNFVYSGATETPTPTSTLTPTPTQ